MSLGTTLRSAREAKGFTTSELAARTHILIQIIEGLENGDYRRIPAAIYGRGFVKLYCEAVGLDPRPLQAEFMTLYTQGKDAPAKMQMPTPPPAPKPPPAPEPVAPPPPVTPEPEPVTPPPPVMPEPVAPPPVMPKPEPVVPPPPVTPKPEPVVPPPPVTPKPEPVVPPPPSPKKAPDPVPSSAEPPRRDYGDLFEQTYAQEDDKPSAAQKFRDTMSNVSSGVFSNVKKLPPNTGRIAVVVAGVIILLALIGWGVFELYKATTPQPEGNPPPAAVEAPKQPEVKPSAAQPKQPETKPATQKPAKPETKPTSKVADAKPANVPASKAPKSVKPGDLRSSGIDVPPLYID